MIRYWWHPRAEEAGVDVDACPRQVADGGEDPSDSDAEADEDGAADSSDADDTEEQEGGSGRNLDRSGVEVTEAGGADPADPKWKKPDVEDIPEFEVRADEPMMRSGGTGGERGADAGRDDPTAGMPNTARSPGDARIRREGAEGYVAALELCALLPEDVRLPDEAAELVPAAVEAELEQDVQSFAAAEFDNASPHVDVLEFLERDGEVWLRLRLGISRDTFSDLDPDAIRAHALQELEGLL